jgi:hypothetical protein
MELEGWISARSDELEVTEAGENKAEKPCTCLYYLQEQTRMTKKEPSLFKFICKGCGIAFSSNVEKDYCFNCAKKKRRGE